MPDSSNTPTSTGSPPADVASLFEDLVRRSYTTYQSRIKASERLAQLNTTWNFALVTGSLAVTINSVVLLVDREATGFRADVLLTCASILTLVISVSVSGMNLSGKSRDMFTSYRRIQRLSVEAERAAILTPTEENLVRLTDEYNDMLDNSDNHLLCDYYKAFPDKRKRCRGHADKVLVCAPIALVAVSTALATPAVMWMFN